jgi:hypothetical protein
VAIDTDLIDAEFDKWKAEVDRLNTEMERIAENEDGLT